MLEDAGMRHESLQLLSTAFLKNLELVILDQTVPIFVELLVMGIHGILDLAKHTVVVTAFASLLTLRLGKEQVNIASHTHQSLMVPSRESDFLEHWFEILINNKWNIELQEVRNFCTTVIHLKTLLLEGF